MRRHTALACFAAMLVACGGGSGGGDTGDGGTTIAPHEGLEIEFHAG